MNQPPLPQITGGPRNLSRKAFLDQIAAMDRDENSMSAPQHHSPTLQLQVNVGDMASHLRRLSRLYARGLYFCSSTVDYLGIQAQG